MGPNGILENSFNGPTTNGGGTGAELPVKKLNTIYIIYLFDRYICMHI